MPRYSGTVIEKLTATPSDPKPNRFYLVETGGTTNFYLSDSKANLLLFNSPSGSAVWGAITGTLTSQSDLHTALNAKEPTITAGTTAQYWRGDKTWQSFNKTAIGLGNVQNVDQTNAANITSGTVNTARLGSGTADNTTFLRGDSSWVVFTGTSTDTLSDVTSRGASTSTGITLTENGNLAASYALRMFRNTDTSYTGFFIQARDAGDTTNLFSVDAGGSIRAQSIIKVGGTSSQFLKADGTVDSSTYLTGNQTITLSGDVSGSGTTAITTTIGTGVVLTAMLADMSVTLAKMADVASGTVFYRKTTGTGLPEVQTLATLKTDLGLSGTNTGDQTITLSGDLAGSGTGAITTTLATVNSNIGTFNGITVNAKGLVTAAVAITAPTYTENGNLSTSYALKLVRNTDSSPVGFLLLGRNAADSATLASIDASGNITGTTIVKSGGTSSQFLKADGSVDSSTYITGNQTITLSGDISGSGTTAITTTIGANKVTLAMMATLAANSLIGNNTGSPATPIALSATQVKTLLSLNNVENTALSTWAGTTNITTLGTIVTGTWSATAILPTKGGTGLTTYTLGDLIYSDATNSLAKLAGNTTGTRNFLRQTGTGTVSAAPAWDTVTKTDVGLANVQNVDQTNASNLTSGTVGTARLGSGTANSTTFLRGDQTWAAPTFTETDTLATVTGRGNTSSSGLDLTENGNTSTSYTLRLTRNTDSSPVGFFIQARNAALGANLFTVDVAGNVTATTIVKSGGTSTQFLKADGSIDSSTYLTGNQTITLSGDISGSGTTAITTTIGANKVLTTNIADANVTLAKMANVATATVFYRKTAGAGVPEVQTLATLKTDLGLTGTNSGDQTITLTGDLTGSGTGSFATTLATVNGNVGTFNNVTVNAKGLVTAASNVSYLTSETDTLASVTGRGNTTSTGLDVTESGNTSTSYGLRITRNTDTASVGFFIQARNAALNSNLFTVDTAGNVTGTTIVKSGGTSSQFLKADGSVDASTYLTSNQTITLSGDISGSGSTAITTTIGANKVTLGMMATVATGTVFYRKTAATGNPEVQTLATLKTDLGLTGTNSGDQTITLTGDVTGSGPGSFATTLATVNGNVGTFNSVTVNAKGLVTAASNVAYLTSETDTLSSVTGRGNTSSSGLDLTENGNLSTSYTLRLTRNTDTSSAGFFIQARNAAVSSNLFTVDTAGNVTATTIVKSGGTSSQFLKADGSVDSSTYLTGNQTITISGDVSGSGTTAITATIGANKVTLGMMATLAANSIIGNNTGSTATPIALTTTQVKTLLALNNVENTALSTWAGSTNLITLGTVTTGTWSATSILPTKGGTGLSTYTLGDTLYSDAANSLAKLAGNITSTKKFLVQTGTGTVSAAPSWGTIATGDLGTGTANSTTFLRGDGTWAAPTFAEADTLATVTGRGNTSSTGLDLTENGNLSTSYTLRLTRNTDTSPVGFFIQTRTAASTNLFTVDVAGNATATTFVKSGGTSAQFLKADGSVDSSTYLTANQTITLSGDISGSGTTAITTAIGANKVTLGMLATLAANTVIGNSTGSTATPTAVPMTTTATASAIVIRDANSNAFATNFLDGYTSTPTSAGNTVLAVGSNRTQIFTGSTTHTVTLPAVSGLALGHKFDIVNVSSGVVTVQSSGANTIQALAPNSRLIVVSNATSGTTAGVWYSTYIPILTNVENTALSTWAGSTNITTLGTITSGTWSASTILPTRGGTGFSTYTLGDLLYSDASNSLAKLAGNTTSTKKFLIQTGTGAVSAAPAWGTIVVGDLGTGTTNSTTFLRGDGTWAVPTFTEADTLATVTGRGNTSTSGLDLTENGNLSTSYTLRLTRNTDTSSAGFFIQARNAAANTNLFTVDSAGNATATTLVKSGGTASQFLKADGSTDSNTYLTGNQTITLSGDISGSGTTAITTTIGANKVTLGMMATLAANSIIGNNTAGTATPIALTASQVKTLLSLNNVENTALSTWAGSANLTTLGTITTGTWSATSIVPTKGGTGISTYILGDTLYSDASNSLAKLAGNITATKMFLRQTGTGTVSAVPAWDTVTKTDVGLANVQNVDQTNASNLTSGTVGTARLGSGTANNTTFLRGDSTWATPPAAVWGTITGTLSSQTDLNTALNARVNKGATVYLSDFASIALAITSIGATVTDLVIDTPMTTAASATFPQTTRLKFMGNGKLTIGSGHTLTVGLMENPGNKQVFVQTDATSNIRFTAGAVNKMNVAWLVGPGGGTCTNAINQYLSCATAIGYGYIFLPQGVWTTAGNHTIVSNLTIEGDGLATVGNGTTVRLTATSVPLFKIGESISNVKFKHMTWDGQSGATTYGLLMEGNAPNSSGNCRLESIAVLNFTTGIYVHSLSGSWQMASLSIDSMSVVSGCSHSAFRCNTINSALNWEANIFVPNSAYALYIESAGALLFKGTEFAGINVAQNNQIEKQTVVAASGITGNGNAKAVVTAAGMSGSPRTVLVPVTTAMTTASSIAAAFRQTLNDDEKVTSFFMVAGTGADVELLALEPAANDATMNFTIQNDTCAGITNNLTSTNQVAGATAPTQPEAVLYDGGAHGPITFSGTQDEGFKSSVVIANNDVKSVLNFVGCLTQGPLRLNGTRTLNFYGGVLAARALRDTASGCRVNILGTVPGTDLFAPDGLHSLYPRFDNFSSTTGGSTVNMELDTDSLGHKVHRPTRFYANGQDAFGTRAPLEALSTLGTSTLRVGACNEMGAPTFYYDFYRSNITGYLNIDGSQAGFAAIQSNIYIFVPDAAYGSGWNGDLSVPTKNAVYGKVSTLAPIASPIFTGTPIMSKALFNGGQDSVTFTSEQIRFGYNGTDAYQHYIHTRHNAGSAVTNAFDFYTSDGTLSGVYPTNAVHGLSISNGKVGIGGIVNPVAGLNVRNTTEQIRSEYSSSVYWNAVTSSGGTTTFTAVGGSAAFTVASATTFTSNTQLNAGVGSNWFPYIDGNNYISAATTSFRDASNTQFMTFTSTAITLADSLNYIYGSSTGTKFGTATSQKLAFWGATPIVQPTTAVAAATFVANAGTAVNDASTFDGYTLKQIVKALRNAGLLA